MRSVSIQRPEESALDACGLSQSLGRTRNSPVVKFVLGCDGRNRSFRSFSNTTREAALASWPRFVPARSSRPRPACSYLSSTATKADGVVGPSDPPHLIAPVNPRPADGKSEEIRRAAAEQLAGVATNQPSQVFALIARVTEPLLGKQWDGRVAASYCLELIAKHCQHHTVKSLLEACDGSVDAGHGALVSTSASSQLDDFDVAVVMKQAKPLVASTGEEFAIDSLRDQQSLQQQKKMLKARLGLDGFAEQLVNADDLIVDEDLELDASGRQEAAENGGGGTTDGDGDGDGGGMLQPQMSLREIAMQQTLSKRKAGFGTLGVKRSMNEADDASLADAVSQAVSKANEEMWEDTVKGSWPLGRLADKLCVDLLHPAWETRHGAALGLRAILGSQAESAGINVKIEDVPTGWLAAEGRGRPNLMPVDAADAQRAARDNASWLEECVMHLLCVLALDQFGDFASDDVVAPVRETAAQALGIVSASMSTALLSNTINSLKKIGYADNWEARHGALSGLKYVLAARCDQSGGIPEQAFAVVVSMALRGLEDQMEDVRSVAAECLIPCVDMFCAYGSGGAEAASQAARVVELLWDALLSLDALNTGTRSASRLLQSLFASNDATGTAQANLNIENVPRLWYQFASGVLSTRQAALECYLSIVASKYAGSMDRVPMMHHICGLFSCLQVIVTDKKMENAELAHQTARLLIDAIQPPNWSQCETQYGLSRLLFEAAMFDTQRAFARPTLAKLPEEGVYEELSDGALEMPALCVAKESAAERRFLAVSIAVHMMSKIPPMEPLASTCASLGSLLGAALSGSNGLKRQVGTLAILAAESSTMSPMVDKIVDNLQGALVDTTCLDELKKPYQSVREKFASLIAGLGDFDLHALTIDEIKHATSGLQEKKKVAAMVATVATIKNAEDAYRLGISCLLAAAWVKLLQDSSAGLPAKLNALIQPLIGGVRREKDEFVQRKAAHALAELIWLSRDRTPSPAGKIVKNLCLFACVDKTQYLDAVLPAASGLSDEIAATPPTSIALDSSMQPDAAVIDAPTPALTASRITSRGGIAALRHLASTSSSKHAIEATMPCLWVDQIMSRAIVKDPKNVASMQGAIQACFLLERIASSVADSSALRSSLGAMTDLLSIDNEAVQMSASAALSSVCQTDVGTLLPFALEGLDGILKDGSSEASKFGGLLAISKIFDGPVVHMVPFTPLLVVYLIRRMSDPAERVRSLASANFAKAVTLLPLAQGLPIPESLSKGQREMVEKDGNFLEQLLDNGNAEDHKLPFELLGATLRRYQQEGINWLAFLRRFGLNGVLADDMGLGKTIQSTSIVASTAMERLATFSSTQDPSDAPKPSLVVCPSTLVSHWPHEISKFVPSQVLSPLRVHGAPGDRAELYKNIGPSSVVVISYETLRSDIATLKKIQWTYIILDEGHAIRNPTSKLSQAARELNGMHRLILSGTPVQNSVMEIWAMFEFLMPGYLGSRAAFNARYGRSVERAKKSRKAKESAQQQASILALQSLHKQVMPFILRRTKDQVLKDLPPKIIQDITCDQSGLQAALLKSFDGKSVEKTLKSLDSSSNDKGHIFKALHFLRKVCSHPVMVLEEGNDSHREAVDACLGHGAASDWKRSMSRIASDLKHSPKLVALKELLNDCGIGVDETEDKESLQTVDAGHRVLVFSQTKAMLNLVEAAVLAPMSVSYLRIDGDVDAVERFNVVQKFNADPTIDVMLLTTSVGGLGLNLTTADTVIFLEHDWNPQKDLQAMDRAHRIGQTRCVSVYRLLVKDTIEESIMSLQRFKLDVAAAVVNADNMSMNEMDTENLLDLFGQEDVAEGKKTGGDKKGLAAMLADLPSLEETEAQYASEFGDVEAFKARVKRQK